MVLVGFGRVTAPTVDLVGGDFKIVAIHVAKSADLAALVSGCFL